MRSLVIALFLVISASTFACPDLAGTYPTCRSTDGTSDGNRDLVITQKLDRGITVYTLTAIDESSNEPTTNIFRADGKTYTETATDPDLGTVKTYTTVTCTKETARGRVSVWIGNEHISDVTSTLSKKDKKLTTTSLGMTFGEDVQDTVICE